MALVLCAFSTALAYTPQFPLKQGWLGADTAGSIPLDGRHRVLWLFSDTYVRLNTGTNRHGAGLVNNSMGIMTWNGHNTNIDYFIRGRDQGLMTSVFPSPGSDANGAWWYWVSDGFKYNGKLYVFLDRNRRTGSTVWSFQGFATDLAVLENVDDEPNPLMWPLTIKQDVLDSTNFMVGVSVEIDTVAGYANLWGTKTVNIGGWNYVYLVLFRLPLAGLENPGPNLEYYSSAGTWLSAAGSDLSDIQLIMANGSPDFSIRYHPDLAKYVDVQCDDGFPAAKVWQRTSSSLLSGWPSGSGATTLVTLANEPGFMTWPAFSYAAKEHLEFYSPVTGQTLLTYCDNSTDTGASSITNVLNNNSLYVPKPRWVQIAPTSPNQPPSACKITSPIDGQNFPGPADITVGVNVADADTNDSIVLVNIFLDGVLSASSGTPPFDCVLRNVGPGPHSLYAEAYDTAEARTNSSAIKIFVSPVPVTKYSAQVMSYAPLDYWRFNEAHGSTIAEEYYHRLDGWYGNQTTNGVAGVVGPPLDGFEATNLAVALNPDAPSGGAGYITLPPLNVNTNAVTLLAWLYPFAPITNAAGILFSRNSTYAVGLNYFSGARAPAGEVGYTWNHTNVSTYGWPSRLYTPPGQWSFVALTISPTQAVLYVGTNGILFSSTNAIAHMNEAWDGPTTIGSDNVTAGSRVFNGKIDEVAVYECALSPADLSKLYTVALVGTVLRLGYHLTETNFILNWKQGTLLESTNVDGPWTPVPGASPPSFGATPMGRRFYQVRVFP